MDEFTRTGWAAHYESTSGQGRSYAVSRAVESFNEDGDALVVETKTGRLRRACDLPGFAGLHETERLMSVVASPPGWWLDGQASDGEEWTEPVIAWVVSDRRVGYPLIPEYDAGTIEVHDGRAVQLRGPEDSDADADADADEPDAASETASGPRLG